MGAGNPLNVVNGNKYQREVDLPALPGVLGLELVRHYNSSASSTNAPNGILGRGWRLSYETELHAVGRNTVQITQADGGRLIFNRDPRHPSQCSHADPAQGRVLIHTGRDGEQYTWVWADGRQLSFNAQGRLTQILAPTGEFVTLQHDAGGHLLKVTDPQGRSLRLNYLDRQAAKAGDRFRGVQSIDTPVGRYTYEYGSALPKESSAPASSVWANLVKVGQPTSHDPSTPVHAYTDRGVSSSAISRVYHYEDGRFPTLLTGISVVGTGGDGRLLNQRLATYGYDERGRAVLSVRGAVGQPGAERVELAFQELPSPGGQPGQTVLIDGQGRRTFYKTAVIGGEFRLLESRGAGCDSCGPANVRYGYERSGRLVSVTGLSTDGVPQQSQRAVLDAQGRTVRVEQVEHVDGRAQPARVLVRYEYEGEGRQPVVVARPSVVAGQEQVTRLAYNEHGQVTQVVERGYSPVDGQGRVVPAGVPMSRTTGYRYQLVNGRSLLSEVDGPLPNGRTGSPADSDVTRYRYDPTGGRIVGITYPMGLQASFGYDDAGRLIERAGLDGVTERLTYDSRGRLTGVQRAGRQLQLAYDVKGQVAEARDALGQHLRLQYDASGQLSELSDGQGNRIAWHYAADDSLRELQLLNPDGSVSQRRQAETLAAVDAALQVALPRLALRLSMPDGREIKTLGGPESAPQAVRTQLDSQARLNTDLFDDFGRLVLDDSPVSGRTVYHHDEADQLVQRVASDGGVTRIGRDALGRGIRVQADGEDAKIEWGRANKPARIAYEAGEERYDYDAEARLTAHTRLIDGRRFTTRYEFDGFGRLQRKVLPDGQRLAYRYNGPEHAKPGVLAGIDREGLVNAPIVTGLNTVEERFHDRGFVHGNGLTHRRLLDVDGRPVQVGSEAAAASQLQWQDEQVRVDYRYAAVPGRAAASQASLPWRQRWAFRLGHLGTEAPPPLFARAAAEATEPRELGETRHDARGRVVEDARHRYVWDGLDRLMEVFAKARDGQAERLVARYRYNVFGERIAKVVYSAQGQKVTRFFYDGAQLTAEADEAGRIVRQYVYLDGRPVAMLSGRAILAIHTDHRLAPLAVTDSTRQVAWQATLTDTGAAVVATGSRLEMPLRGSNQYFDAETGLHYNTHRYLDPQQGRYLSPDPLGLAAGPDLYEFALGQPHRHLDPLGLAPALDVPSMGFGDKLREVFLYAAKGLPAEIGHQLKELVSPTNIAGTVAIFALWGASHALGAGFLADIALVGMAYWSLGNAGIDFVKGLLSLVDQINGAQCESDLEKAGETLLATTNILIDAVGKKGKSGSDAIDSVFGGGKGKLTNPPPPGSPPPAPSRLVLHPTSIPQVARGMVDEAVKNGRLTQRGPNDWVSLEGLRYKGTDKNGANRIEHIGHHLTLDPARDRAGKSHSVFVVSPDKLLEVLDEAWKKSGPNRRPVSQSDQGTFVIKVGTIGAEGETHIRIITKRGTNPPEVISAYPYVPVSTDIIN
ncbi:hypothetical protein AAW51_4971 [Caldimonas brevitalea]|uniref:RHS repeat-associated core domain-containing protein n=1 Tax=Caldimonas brevitalea TaxID=413882 RepID=A0A0G3BQF2_9BURK|nr:hypothetical protein AAW51_4971 [Caldimonas brevitalea]